MKKYTKLLALAIISVSVTLAVISSWGDTPILDEIPHIGAGYSYLVKQNMRLNPEHPPLAKDLAATPLMFMDLNQSVFESKPWTDPYYKVQPEYGQWDFGRELLYDHGNNGEQIKNFMRLPMLLFFILAGILAFSWGRRLYGDRVALLTLTLFSFSPSIVAHARFVTTDVPALFGVVLAIFFFVKYLKNPSKKSLIIAGLAFGIAQLTKFSLILLIPSLGLAAVIFGFVQINEGFISRIKNSIRYGFISCLIFIIGFLFIVWPVYFVQSYNYPVWQQKQDNTDMTKFLNKNFSTDLVIWMSDKPLIRSFGQYLLGVTMASNRAAGGNTIFFRGYVVDSAGPIYFPFVYFIKETLAWWALAAIALIATLWKIFSKKLGVERTLEWMKNHTDEMAMLCFLLIYWGVSITSKLNLGVRHILPVFPFMIILVSGQIGKIIEKLKNLSRVSRGDRISENGPKRISLVAGLVIIIAMPFWHILENIKIFPYYLTYFNEAVGGPRGGANLVTDSNLDWGQDLKRLGIWMNENEVAKVSLDFFGWADKNLYLGAGRYDWITSETFKDANDFISRNTTDGWIAISGTFFEQATNPRKDGSGTMTYAWLKAYQPIKVVGNSMFVFHIK